MGHRPASDVQNLIAIPFHRRYFIKQWKERGS
jgi:hypothetical protein